MQSRTGKSDYVERFPQIVAELSLLPDCTIDGELVVLDADGGSVSQGLTGGQASFVVWDVLELGADDLRGLPLDERREKLHELLQGGTLVGVSPVFDDGEALLEEVRRR